MERPVAGLDGQSLRSASNAPKTYGLATLRQRFDGTDCLKTADPRQEPLLRNVAAITALAIGISLGLIGCTAEPATREPVGSSTAASSAPQQDEDADHNATIEAFVSAVFEYRYDDAMQHASPGSPAERYVIHQQAVDTGLNANGDGYTDPATEPTVTFDGDTATVVESGQSPYELTDFTFDQEGLVEAWTGKSGPVAEVLWTAPWTGQTGGNTIDLVSAYKANSGSLFVVLKVTANERSTSAFGYSASYSASDGITYTVESSSQPGDIAAGSAGYFILGFPSAPFGGTVNLDGTSPDDYSISWTAQVPVS